ncbi:MAG: iron-sulfur cluster insertion protein ErpA [Bdellovibrionota bacterium]|nr:iron-sulfur cluster insertion protein ErpA [Deltaproteobacteria bacterium]
MVNITLTDSAKTKVKTFAKSEAQPGEWFRVYVQGGGCSGFEYGFSFDQPTDQDYQMQIDDIQIVIDPFSATYVQDAVIDYFEDFRGAGFSVKNPNAKTTCGCGMSFGV